MKKEIREFEVPFAFDWEYGIEIKKLREDLDELEKLGATTISIDIGDYWGDSIIEIGAYVTRMETDDEARARIAEHRDRENAASIREIEELKRLKEKYKDYCFDE